MNYDDCRAYLLSKPEAFEDYPFGPVAAVFKVQSKMFATLGVDDDDKTTGQMNLKCDPQEALMLRDIFPAIIPGYHMNKVHWNTVVLDGSVPPAEIRRMIDNSYSLVVRGLRKAERLGLELRHGKENLYR